MDPITKYLNSISYKFPKGYPDMNDVQDVTLLESLLSGVLGEKFSLQELGMGKLGKSEIIKYPYRVDLFVKKFTTKSPFTNSKTEEDVVLDKITIKGKEFTPDGDKNDIRDAIFDAAGDVKVFGGTLNGASLTSLSKTQEFGGGGGSRGGTSNTSVQESTQSLVNALAYKKGKLNVEDLTPENLKSVLNDVEVDVSNDDMLDFVENQPTWTESLVGTANFLLSRFPNRGYTQHRQSKFVKELYKHAGDLVKNDPRLSGGGRIGLDKWNPSDIWMTTLSSPDILLKTDSLDSLNALILQLYVDESLVGISLKKTTLTPPSKEYQIGEEIKFDKYEGHSKATTSTKSTYVDTTGPRVEFRTFGNPGFSAEVQGVKAGGGKAGETAINNILKANGIPKLQNLRSPSKEDFIELYNKYADEKIQGIDGLEQILDGKGEEIITRGAGKGSPKGPRGANDWLISRNFGLQMVDIFNNSKDKDKLLQGILRYAYSSNEWSSTYIKVGN